MSKGKEKKTKVRMAPKKFTVGTEGCDFHPGEIEALAFKLAQWFQDPRSGRKYEDPLQTAKDLLQQCLSALASDGTPWGKCPDNWASRVRIKCNYDVEKDEGLVRGNLFNPEAKGAIDPKADKAVRDAVQSLDPIGQAFDREGYERDMVAGILKEYPELDNSVHRPNVERLAMAYAEQQSVRVRLQMTEAGSKKYIDLLDAQTKLEQSAERTMKLLDIHPDQLRKKLDKRREGTLGDLITVLEGDAEFEERERLWALQAALQFWWMSNHANGRGDGPNLHDWEIWHATRSVPIDYTCSCGKHVTLIRGFEPKELQQYLIERGVLVEEPAIPGLLRSDALDGLAGDWDSSPATGLEIRDGAEDPTGEDTNAEEGA